MIHWIMKEISAFWFETYLFDKEHKDKNETIISIPDIQNVRTRWYILEYLFFIVSLNMF